MSPARGIPDEMRRHPSHAKTGTMSGFTRHPGMCEYVFGTMGAGVVIVRGVCLHEVRKGRSHRAERIREFGSENWGARLCTGLLMWGWGGPGMCTLPTKYQRRTGKVLSMCSERWVREW